jgi:hypothetical protein
LTRLLRSRLLAHRITSRRRGNSLAVIEASFGEDAAEQAAWSSSGKRPSCPQWHLLGLAKFGILKFFGRGGDGDG